MRASLLWPVFVAAAIACAGEREERTDIERVIRALNDGQRRDLLSTPEAQQEFDQLSKLAHRLLQSPDVPWSEVTRPSMIIQSVRFITPDVALVDAVNTQYGSVILRRRIPVLLVMRKDREWRIASLRLVVDRWVVPEIPR